MLDGPLFTADEWIGHVMETAKLCECDDTHIDYSPEYAKHKVRVMEVKAASLIASNEEKIRALLDTISSHFRHIDTLFTLRGQYVSSLFARDLQTLRTMGDSVSKCGNLGDTALMNMLQAAAEAVDAALSLCAGRFDDAQARFSNMSVFVENARRITEGK